MAKRWRWAACLLLTIVCLVAGAEVARCQDYLEQTVDRVCRRIPRENKARKLECQAVVIMSMDSHNADSLKTAQKMLEQAHAIAPNDLSILNNTAFCYVKQKQYETALSILENSLNRQPNNFGVKNFTCMLKERLGYPRSEYRACYHSVVQAVKEKKMAKGINYVITVLVADEPDAQAIKDKYLAGLNPINKSTESEKKYLENFNRDEYIRKHLP